MSDAAVPKDKFDLAALAHAKTIGFPKLDPQIPALLEWLQDPNWPVFHPTADLLASAGPALLPALRQAFASEDADWISALLSELCPRLPSDLQDRLAPDIAAITARP